MSTSTSIHQVSDIEFELKYINGRTRLLRLTVQTENQGKDCCDEVNLFLTVEGWEKMKNKDWL